MSTTTGEQVDDREELAGYVEVWWQAVNDFLDLLEQLPEEEWTTPTDLAGWDVRACAAHTAHLEGILAGGPEETADVGEPPHVTGLHGALHRDRRGQPARRQPPTRSSTRSARPRPGGTPRCWPTRRPTAAPSPSTSSAASPWTWRVLLRNRPLDVWMHEQDVRRAVGRPGGMDTAPARHTAEYLAESLGFVLGKKVGAPTGTSLVLEMDGQRAVRLRDRRQRPRPAAARAARPTRR